MMAILLVVLVGGALIWMLMPSTPGVRRTPTSSSPGWWGFPGMGSGSGGTAHSSHSSDCSSGVSSDGGGSCGGGGD
jgi:hypothetical protein